GIVFVSGSQAVTLRRRGRAARFFRRLSESLAARQAARMYFFSLERVFDPTAFHLAPAGQNIQAPDEFMLESQPDFLHHTSRGEVYRQRSSADLFIPPFPESAVE